MIDIHSHVLFGMDDGARTLEDSVALVRMAAECGTTDLVATPHANPMYSFEPELIEERLSQVVAASGNVLRLYTGCDFHLSFDNIQDALANPRKYTINHKKYLLVEFSDLLILKNTQEVFSRLLDAGMIPIITHPERNALLRQRLDDIAKWVELGALVQVTAMSVTGSFGRKAQDFCTRLLDHQLVQIVASDAHDVQHRVPRMDEAYAWLEENYDESTAKTLCVRNPKATLTGGEIYASVGSVDPPERKWYKFW